MTTQPAHAPQFSHRQSNIPQRQHGQRDEAAGVPAAPVVEMPVVVGLDGGEGEFFVLHLLEARTGKTGKGPEADRAQYAVRIHVPDPRIDVVTTGTHLLIGYGLEPIFLPGPARNRIEPEPGRLLTFDLPMMGAVGAMSDNRSAILESRGYVPDEHVLRLDQVIVHADENQIRHLHRYPLTQHLTARHRKSYQKNDVMSLPRSARAGFPR